MERKIKLLTALFVLFWGLSAFSEEKFTAAETQQISIATPGLFDKANSFTIDLASIKEGEYSFPLPVGKNSATVNNAVEISTTKGDAVKAMFAGRVRLARKTAKLGNVIVIRHENGLETVYAHNAQNLVKVDQEVKAGQSIAIVGVQKGKAACLFMVMVNGGRINPAIIIDLKSYHLRKSALLFEKKGTRVNVSTIKEKNVSDKPTTDKKGKQEDKKDKQEDKKSKEEDKKHTTDEKITADKTLPKPQKTIKETNTNRLDLTAFANDEWAYPLPGSHVISPYGGKRRHSGVDIKTKPNDKILAAFGGLVTRSGPFFGYGNCIVIRHNNGLETLYSHQSKNFVKVGQVVKAGDVIGLTGRTGRATTEHLHFETFFKGRRFDPALVFNHASKSLRPHTLVYSSGIVRVEKPVKEKNKK